jgi:D-sedoheptulose 7-phosphate isomerase
MSEKPSDAVKRHFQRSVTVLAQAADDPALCATVTDIAGRVERALRNGGKLLIAGNGGSAADAQHIAAELVSRFKLDRGPLPAIALTTDTSLLTAVGNDYGFEHVFERQVQGLGRPGDVFLAISTSGRSPNVLAALRAAREMDIVTVGFTGSGGEPLRALCDVCLSVASEDTALIQQVHLVAAHAICEVVETAMFGSQKNVGNRASQRAESR